MKRVSHHIFSHFLRVEFPVLVCRTQLQLGLQPERTDRPCRQQTETPPLQQRRY